VLSLKQEKAEKCHCHPRAGGDPGTLKSYFWPKKLDTRLRGYDRFSAFV
jgi:hypothetical protein